jgi:hypothetical protein
MTAGVQFRKNSGREPQGARRQDELIGGKRPVVNVFRMVLTINSDCFPKQH